MKCVLSYKINRKCEKKNILSLFINPHSIFDESYSLNEEDNLKFIWILLLKKKHIFFLLLFCVSVYRFVPLTKIFVNLYWNYSLCTLNQQQIIKITAISHLRGTCFVSNRCYQCLFTAQNHWKIERVLIFS
jgi:hypothetical protein